MRVKPEAVPAKENAARVWPWLKRNLWWLVSGLLLVGGVIWGWQASAQFMPVKKIELEGDLQQVTSEQLRQVVAPLVGEGFLQLQVSQVRDAVEALPWVYQATVRRVWPDTLAIALDEQQVVASWQDGALVNPQGELFYPQQRPVLQEMPEFEGIPGQSLIMVQRFNRYRAELDRVGLTVNTLQLTERRAWTVTLDNGITLMMGRDMDEKTLPRFARAYELALAERADEIAAVDLRYTNGFAVRWKTNKTG